MAVGDVGLCRRRGGRRNLGVERLDRHLVARRRLCQSSRVLEWAGP